MPPLYIFKGDVEIPSSDESAAIETPCDKRNSESNNIFFIQHLFIIGN
jgi:hypothetical protein